MIPDQYMKTVGHHFPLLMLPAPLAAPLAACLAAPPFPFFMTVMLECSLVYRLLLEKSCKFISRDGIQWNNFHLVEKDYHIIKGGSLRAYA